MEGTAIVGGVLIFMAIVLLIALIVWVFYCLTLQKAFNRVSPENRAMAPGLVWLLVVAMLINIPLSLVPMLKILSVLVGIFGVVWHFVVVLKLATSLGAEFKKRSIAAPAAPGKTMGLVTCSLSACTVVISGLAVVAPPLGLLVLVTGLAGFVCMIIYWVQIAGFSGKLAAPAA